jgi:hypothetical protein
MVSTESAALRLIGLRMLAAGGWPVATAMRGAQSETRLMEEAVDELYASLARTPTDDDRRSLWMALLRAWQSELADRYVRASGRRHALRHGEIDSAIQRAREALGGR